MAWGNKCEEKMQRRRYGEINTSINKIKTKRIFNLNGMTRSIRCKGK